MVMPVASVVKVGLIVSEQLDLGSRSPQHLFHSASHLALIRRSQAMSINRSITVDQNRNTQPRARTVRGRAFTLVELLVVMSVIALLIALLLPALAAARSAAKASVCLSNMRSWGTASATFASDNVGAAPRGIDYYATWSGGGNSPTASRPAAYDGKISPSFYPNTTGGVNFGNNNGNDTHSVSVRINYPNGVGGQTMTWRLTDIGVQVLRGYVSDAQMLYCPDMERPLADGTGFPNYWYMDRPVGATFWNNLSQGRTACNPYSTMGAPIGYASFLHGLGVSSTNRESRWVERPTMDWIGDNWKRNTDVSPMMYGCVVDTGSDTVFDMNYTPHIQGNFIGGINGVMFDGSARWISLNEVKTMARAYPSLNTNNETGGWRENYRIDNNSWMGEVASASLYAGRRVRFNYLARYAMGLTRSPK
jgi:prepilin-type N-terminal cleavage/methylation domain-containing protein